MRGWTIQDALEVYEVNSWGSGFFTVNERGQAEQQRDDRQQRRDRVGLEQRRHAAGDAEPGGVEVGGAVVRGHGCAPARPALTASVATRSPAFSPASTSVAPPCAAPVRTARSTNWRSCAT